MQLLHMIKDHLNSIFQTHLMLLLLDREKEKDQEQC
jgi:hypothetical protein